MPKGRCPALPGECEKAGEVFDFPDGTEFVCPVCEQSLDPISQPVSHAARWPIALAVLVLLGGGGYFLYGLPKGESDISLGAGGMTVESEAPVRGDSVSAEAEFAVPIIDFEPSEEWPAAKRELTRQLIFAADLPAGKTYDVSLKAPYSSSIDEGTSPSLPDGAATRVATDDLLAQAVQQREETLSAFDARWETMQLEIENYRAALERNLPPPCTTDTAPLIREITRKGTDECPRIEDDVEREACFLEVQQLNSELGECETRNQVRQEAQARALRSVSEFREEKLDSLQAELEQDAIEHNNGLAPNN